MSDTTTTWRPARPGETPGQMIPECTPESCTDPGCTNVAHLPEPDDTADRSWLDHQGFLDDFETEEER